MAKGLSLDAFKEALKTDKIKIIDDIEEDMNKYAGEDKFSPQDGVAIIHRKNLNKYLEEFMCKNEDELSDFLYYNKGIFLKVI